MNSLSCLGGPGFFGSGRVRVRPALVSAGFGPGLRICGPGRPIARLESTPIPIQIFSSDLTRQSQISSTYLIPHMSRTLYPTLFPIPISLLGSPYEKATLRLHQITSTRAFWDYDGHISAVLVLQKGLEIPPL